MILLVDRRNPRLMDGALSLEDVGVLPHAVANFGAAPLTPGERILGEFDLEPHVALQVYGFLPLSFVIEGTDMVALVPEMLARVVLHENDALVAVEPPFHDVTLAESYWDAPAPSLRPGSLVNGPLP
jgi:hypothetical protein